MREAFTDIVHGHGRPLMKMSLNHLIDELVVALGISPEAAARHLGERGPDAVGDPVVLPQPDVLYEKEETLLHLVTAGNKLKSSGNRPTCMERRRGWAMPRSSPHA